MHTALLDVLRCPFCGGRLRPLDGRAREADGGPAAAGVLGCQCCAYPVVDGVPFLRTGPAAETAVRLVGQGDAGAALLALLGLKGDRAAAFRRLADDPGCTFRDALGVLCSDTEAAYLLYRFSDPTYLCSRAVLDAVGHDRRCFSRGVIDVGGGAGHLTRALCHLAGRGAAVVLADIAFWKVWLAKRFVAPACVPVCCDANAPLPFARQAFSLALCSDAFHYVWSRRLLASELLRLIGRDGVVLLTHLHNRLCENPSAGMPLAPADYRELFEGTPVRLFKEGDVLARVLDGRPADLSTPCLADELSQEPALVLLATGLTGLDQSVGPGGEAGPVAPLSLNPLYRVEQDGGTRVLRLRFPSADYEAEYASCKRYLPDWVRWDEDMPRRVRAGALDGELRRLADRHVLIDLPPRYC